MSWWVEFCEVFRLASLEEAAPAPAAPLSLRRAKKAAAASAAASAAAATATVAAVARTPAPRRESPRRVRQPGKGKKTCLKKLFGISLNGPR